MTEKKKTISTRWSDFTKNDKGWARTCIILQAMSLNGLWLHLWVLTGIWRTVGLIGMIVFISLAQIILFWKKVFWWFWFWNCIIATVIAFEIASYFFGG